MDWAIVERLKLIVGAFGDINEVRYRDLPPWRLIIVALGAAIVGAEMTTSQPVGLLFWVGLTIFAGANFYGDTIALRR